MARTKPPSANMAKLAERIHSVDDHPPHCKALVYGANGSGKTRLAASAPSVIIIDIEEEGTRSAKGSGAKVFEAKTWQDIGDFYWYLKSGKHKYESVSLDTITAMNALALSFVLGEAEDRDPTREKSMPDKRTWGRAGTLMRGMLLAYRNLPMHVIFTAQERSIRDEDTEEIIDITVDLPNSSRGAAMGCVGILGRMVPREVTVRNKKTKKKERKWMDHLIVGPHEVMRTKDRTFALPPVVRSPTMGLLIDAWNDDEEEE